MNPWTFVVNKVNRKFPKRWKQSPFLTSGFHALMVVLGVVPVPIGLAGIAYFLWTSHSWLWIIGSGISLVWYWVREYRQNGIKPKPEFYQKTSKVTGWNTAVRCTFSQRYDPWFDVLVPTFAYGLQLGLLGWLW